MKRKRDLEFKALIVHRKAWYLNLICVGSLRIYLDRSASRRFWWGLQPLNPPKVTPAIEKLWYITNKIKHKFPVIWTSFSYHYSVNFEQIKVKKWETGSLTAFLQKYSLPGLSLFYQNVIL